jgi:hypothetical protein
LDLCEKVIIYAPQGEAEFSCSIPWWDIKSVAVLKKNQELGPEESIKSIIDLLGLESIHGSGKKNTYLEFY